MKLSWSLAMQRRIARIAMLAVLLHAFAPLAHAYRGTGTDFAGSLCSVANVLGVQSASIAGPGRQPDAPAAGITRLCPLCLAGAQIALPVTPVAAHLDTRLFQAVVSAPVQPAVTLQRWYAFTARAPPRG